MPKGHPQPQPQPNERQQDETKFIMTALKATEWPWQQYKRLYHALPPALRSVQIALTTVLAYWLYESGAWCVLIGIAVAAFIVAVIVDEERLNRKHPHRRPAPTHQPRANRKRRPDTSEQDWWDDMMNTRQRDEEPGH